jgi:hypothetical protein
MLAIITKNNNMKYYGIVSEIKEEHKTGIYGRRKPSTKESIDILYDLGIKIDEKYSKYINFILYLNTAKSLYNIFLSLKKQPIIFQIKLPESAHKQLVIKSNLLGDNFNLDKNFSYGLIDDFSIKERIRLFKTLITSNGGSSLIIVDRNDLPLNIKHYGGVKGRFNEGLYVPHPKDENLLLPLKNFNDLIQSLILEETIRVYEALGSKEILIEDVTEISNETKVEKGPAKVDITGDFIKEVLRLKKFGKGTFDVNRALNDKLFIHDIPAVMTTIDARINGNQTLEEFTETIDLNIGIDISVLKFFEIKNDISYRRKWHFKVEFYDKNEINNS